MCTRELFGLDPVIVTDPSAHFRSQNIGFRFWEVGHLLIQFNMLRVIDISIQRVVKPVGEKLLSILEDIISTEDEGNNEIDSIHDVRRETERRAYDALKRFVRTWTVWTSEQFEGQEEKILETLVEYGHKKQGLFLSRENFKHIDLLVNLSKSSFEAINTLPLIRCYNCFRQFIKLQNLILLYRPIEVYGGEEPLYTKERPLSYYIETERTIIKARNFFRFADAIYLESVAGSFLGSLTSNYSQFEVFSIRSRCSLSDILFAKFINRAFLLPYAIVNVKTSKELCLVFRGTNNLFDVVTNFLFQYVCIGVQRFKGYVVGFRAKYFVQQEGELGDIEFLLNKVNSLIRSPVLRAYRAIPAKEVTEDPSEDFLTHGGMLKCALSAFHKTVQQIYELKFYPTYNHHNLVICGHSLGGSVATLVYFMFYLYNQNLKDLNENQGCKFPLVQSISANCFGSGPCIFFPNKPDQNIEIFKKVVTFVNKWDFAARCSYGMLKDLENAVLSLAARGRNQQTLISSWRAPQDIKDWTQEQKQHFEALCELFERIENTEKRHQRLTIPGRVFMIGEDPRIQKKYKGKHELYFFYEIDKDEVPFPFKDIPIFKNCVEEHRLDVYMRRMSRPYYIV